RSDHPSLSCFTSLTLEPRARGAVGGKGPPSPARRFPQLRDRMRLEAAILHVKLHGHLVRGHDFLETGDGRPAIIMEVLHGKHHPRRSDRARRASGPGGAGAGVGGARPAWVGVPARARSAGGPGDAAWIDTSSSITIRPTSQPRPPRTPPLGRRRTPIDAAGRRVRGSETRLAGPGGSG